MVKFGKKLKEHVVSQSLPAECYVDYKGLKTAIKSGCSEDVFQELYNFELEKFVQNLDRGMAADRQFVELNRLALDNICKKFDKRRNMIGDVAATSLRVRNRARVPLAGETHTEAGERLHGWVYDPELAARVFRELDTNNDGKITSAAELAAGLKTLNLGATKGVVDSIMDIADQDNDGVISLEDFQRFVRAPAPLDLPMGISLRCLFVRAGVRCRCTSANPRSSWSFRAWTGTRTGS
jgi:hypothetical protein